MHEFETNWINGWHFGGYDEKGKVIDEMNPLNMRIRMILMTLAMPIGMHIYNIGMVNGIHFSTVGPLINSSKYVKYIQIISFDANSLISCVYFIIISFPFFLNYHLFLYYLYYTCYILYIYVINIKANEVSIMTFLKYKQVTKTMNNDKNVGI